MNSTANPRMAMDLASLADIVVADLAILRRTGQQSTSAFERAIELCDRLAMPSCSPESLALPSPPSDAGRKHLHATGPADPKTSGTDLEELARIKQQLLRLCEEPEGVPTADLVQIQEFIVRATASHWQEHARDFQQRRLKRGLKQQSL